MFINQQHMDTWRTRPHPQPQPLAQAQALYTSPLWSAQSVKSFATTSVKSYSTSPTSVDSNETMVDSSRALQLRYNEINHQLQQCRVMEAQLMEQQEKIVSSLFISGREFGFTSNPTISPPQPVNLLDERDPPPTREQMVARLVEGQREHYRRIFVPGRGWVSKTNLQNELRISEGELEHMAKL